MPGFIYCPVYYGRKVPQSVAHGVGGKAPPVVDGVAGRAPPVAGKMLSPEAEAAKEAKRKAFAADRARMQV